MILDESLINFFDSMGFKALTWGHILMLATACCLHYLAIVKKYEPLLLLPIAFGMLLANLPLTGLMEPDGLLYWLSQGVRLGIYPPLIFLGIGAMTDFGPLLANPSTIFFGAAAPLGIFVAFLGAIALPFFDPYEAAATAIIGGAGGATALYVTSIVAPHLFGPVAIAAYSYMALVPIIQPPIMRVLTTNKERQVVMKQLRPVSRAEKILFPIVVTVFTSLFVPHAASLLGMLMLGNLLRESGVAERLAQTSQNDLINIVTLFLAISVGATASAENFLRIDTIMILMLGLIGFVFGTGGGILLGKLMCLLTKGKINPLIGSAGVSAVPMAARVSHVVGQQENRGNYLLMHAMGPNVAGVIGSAIIAGVLLSFLS